jgi:hypothetical protein
LDLRQRVYADNPEAAERARVRRLTALYNKYTEGLRLIRPTPRQEAFLACQKKTRVAEGSNRSLKTTAAMIEFARAVTGQDPHDKFPASGQGLVVALDWQPHISELWRKLTQPGEFKTIIDEKTKLPRAVRPDPNDPTRVDPHDEAYQEKWQDGAPLIPESAIQRVQFESKSPATPRWARFVSPRGCWEIDYRSSKGEAVRGKHYNLALFDEQLSNEDFYYEAMRALVRISELRKHTPRFWWSATSQIPNPQYYELCEQAASGSPHVETFLFLIKDNPFISADEKQAFHDSLPEDERRARYYGEHAMVAQRIYPGFDPMGPHGCEPFEIPPTWARFFAVDPGRETCATVFCAIPPEETHIYIYDAFLVKSQGARAWAGEMTARQRDTMFEAGVIDQQAGQQHGMGNEDNEGVADKYWEAAMEAGVKIKQVSGAKWAGFFPGTKDVRGREESVRTAMAIRGLGPGTGSARLQLFRGCLPQLEKEIRYATMDKDDPTKRLKKKHIPDHLVSAMEYLVHFDPGYFSPEPICAPPKEPSLWDEFREMERRQRQQERMDAMLPQSR